MPSDFILPQTARLFMMAVERQTKSLGISAGQVPALLILAETPNLTQAELAQKTAIAQPTIANTLKRMERDGLLVQSADGTDKRKHRYALSDHAQQKLPDVKRALGRVLKQAQHTISPEHMRIYISVMTQIVTNLGGDENDQ